MNTLLTKATNEVISSASVAISNANSPEEAYKLFIAVAGRGMMQVVAEALAAAVSSAQSENINNNAIDGWERFITGCTMDMNFGLPIYTDITNVNNSNFVVLPVTKLHWSTTTGMSTIDSVRGSVSVSGSWSF